MTQGLLNSAFHDKADGDRRRDLEEFRGQLAASVYASVGTIGSQELQAANIPLFRQGPSGLQQAVRFRVPLAAGPDELHLSLARGDGGTYGTWDFRPLGGYLAAEATLPEVRHAAQVEFEVAGKDPASLCRGHFEVRPQRKWTVSLIHHTHLDIGYTDRQEVVMAHHLQYLDSVLDLVHQTSGWESDAQFRWNIEVSWPLQQWLASRGESERERMMAAVRSGHVSVGALSLNLHTEACAIEELYEMVRFAVELRREHGLQIPSAMQTDVPGGVTALVEVLTDAGARYLSVAHNYAGRSVPYLIGGEKLERPFYWRAPSGKRLLVWHTDTLHGNAYMEGNIVGLADSFSVAEETLPHYLAALAERPYPFDSGTWLPEAQKIEREPYPHDVLHLRVQGKYGDNAPPNIAVAEIARQWNATWAYPHLCVDRNEDFFRRAEERLAGRIPEWQGDWADWWADGLGSGARMLGWARDAQAKARAGRSLHSISGLLKAEPPAPVAEVDRTYADIGLFDEHTWGARHPWGDDEEGWGSGALQWQRKADFARSAREGASALVSTGARRAARGLGGRDGLATIVVLNTSGWARTDVVKVFVPSSTVPSTLEVCVVDDRDGAKVATATVAQEHVNHRPLGRFLVFLARDVPPLGYARFNVVEGTPVTTEPAPTGDVVENEFYRVTLSPDQACIASIVDIAGSRELVNTRALLGFNSYVFDRYGTSTRVDHLSGRIFSRGLDLIAERLTGEAGVVLRREANELWEKVVVDVRAPGCARLLSIVSLWRGVPRVEVHNRLWKQKTVDKQSVFFAFPLAGDDPELAYELPGVATSASAPTVPGCPQHMRAVRHWVALSGTSGSTAWATVDAPLVQLKDIHSPYSPFPGTLPLLRPEPATVYSWALNNIWDTNFPTEQGGEMSFRYAITSGGPGNAAVMGARLGESVSSPLVASLAPLTSATKESPSTGSFCVVGEAEVRLVQATPSRDGKHVLLWLNNIADHDVTTTVSFPDLTTSRVCLGTVFEEDQADLELSRGTVTAKLRAGETRALAVVVDGRK